LCLERVDFLPAFTPPHKSGEQLTPAHHRLRILELLLQAEEGVSIDTRELRAGHPVYTARSLASIAAEHEGALLFFLLGEDSFRALDGWRDPEGIAALCQLIVAPRRADGVPSRRPTTWRNTRVHWLDFHSDLSSTRVRESLRASGTPDGLPAVVLSYIRAHALYRAGPT
jgi:nicotinate-nucleotide adenylyltransferase